jgi:hypothetical protein
MLAVIEEPEGGTKYLELCSLLCQKALVTPPCTPVERRVTKMNSTDAMSVSNPLVPARIL